MASFQISEADLRIVVGMALLIEDQTSTERAALERLGVLVGLTPLTTTEEDVA